MRLAFCCFDSVTRIKTITRSNFRCGPSTTLKLFPKSDGILVAHVPACLEKRRMTFWHVFDVVSDHKDVIC